MIDFGGYLWQAMGIGVIVLGVVIAIGTISWRRRHRDSATQEVRDHATRRIYEAEEQRARSEASARSPR